MVNTSSSRVYLWPLWGGLGVGFLPVVLAWIWILVEGTFPYTLGPAVVAAPGLFVLETLLEFQVPTTQTHVETVTVLRRWLVFGVVNALLWAGFLLAGTWIVKRLWNRNRSDPWAKMQELAELEQWDACLETFRRLEREGDLAAHQLVQKSACLQLGSKLGDLEEAERALEAALERAKDYLPALIDLGWFHYAVRDDTRKALVYFERAEEVSRGTLEEALKGKRECLEEL